MPDDRDWLEAVIWQQLRYIDADQHPHAADIVQRLMHAADQYAAGDGQFVTELRRDVLHNNRTDIGHQGATR
jgi:hypothetical protein